MKPNRNRLRKLMAEHDIKGPDVAKLLSRELATVHVWMSTGGRDIPSQSLELLEIKVSQSA